MGKSHAIEPRENGSACESIAAGKYLYVESVTINCKSIMTMKGNLSTEYETLSLGYNYLLVIKVRKLSTVATVYHL